MSNKKKNGASLPARPSLPGVYTAKKKDGRLYYRASFTYHNKHISLGSFQKMEDANGAYQEALSLVNNDSLSIMDYKNHRFLPFEKWVILCNFRDNKIYFSTPIYIRNKYFSYFLDSKIELKFSIDDLFYFSSRKIMHRKGHFFVSDYGMQVTILSRYGIKSYGIQNKDYRLINGDPYDFRYENIEILNHYHGVTITEQKGKIMYQARIHIKGYYVIGYFDTDIEAAIAYNKAIDVLRNRNCNKNFSTNYINDISASEYANIYHHIKIPDKIQNLSFPMDGKILP